MSRYAQAYREAGQMPLLTDLSNYHSMMNNKRDIMEFGARLLAMHRARQGGF